MVAKEADNTQGKTEIDHEHVVIWGARDNGEFGDDGIKDTEETRRDYGEGY